MCSFRLIFRIPPAKSYWAGLWHPSHRGHGAVRSYSIHRSAHNLKQHSHLLLDWTQARVAEQFSKVYVRLSAMSASASTANKLRTNPRILPAAVRSCIADTAVFLRPCPMDSSIIDFEGAHRLGSEGYFCQPRYQGALLCKSVFRIELQGAYIE